MLSTLTQEAVGAIFQPPLSIRLCVCVLIRKKFSFVYWAVRLVLEVSGWLGRGETTCARRQKSYTRSVKEGDARGDPEIEAESGKDFEVEEWRAC